MTTTQIATINRATEVIADNAARRIAAGRTFEQAQAEAVAEFSERWPALGSIVGSLLSR